VKKLYARAIAYLSVDHPSPGLKQLPLAVVFVLSLLIVLLVPGIEVTDITLATIGIGLLVAATVLSAILTVRPKLDRWAIVIPLVDFLAIGTFRAGTGGILSLFGAMLILPVVWVAAERGRRYILIAALGTAIVLLAPYAFDVVPFQTGSDYVRGFFSPLVYLFAAAIINELARQSRSQLRAIREFADEKDRMLQRLRVRQPARGERGEISRFRTDVPRVVGFGHGTVGHRHGRHGTH
jgi:uncharacterized membrane protein